MKKKWLALIIVLLLLVTQFSSVAAQNLSFQVERSDASISINADGTASIDYLIVFYNEPGADPIDYIDIGLPNNSYDLGGITADVDGKTISDIEESTYATVDSGVALGLGSDAIQPGQRSQVRVHIATVRNMLYFASAKEAETYASFQFSPNWFGSDFVRGNTDMTVTLYLPPGLKPEEPRYFTPQGWPGAAEPESGLDAQSRVYYRWQSQDANSHTQYRFGASFPSRLVPQDTLSKEPTFLSSLLAWIGENFCCLTFFFIFFAFIVLVIYASIWGNRKRKLQYLPPKISIEGHGIKRGLTAIEAAILMEQPMDKVLTMILFSTIKKGAATVTSRDPLKVQVTSPLPEGLQPYEEEFLKAFSTANAAQQRKALQDVMVNLVKDIGQKMKGFSRKETVAYYKDIMTKAWQQVETADTPEVQIQKFDEAMDWAMLDRDFEDHTRRVFTPTPVFMPVWWGRYDPGYSSAGTSRPAQSTSAPSSPGGSVSLPHLPGSDFAASMVTGIQTFSAGVVGDVTNFTSAITNRTNPAPKPTTSSSRSWGGGGGGGGCACACACAGCACACAGGGR